MTSTITLVGNRFAGFAATPGIETIETFLELLKTPSALATPVLVRVGQGVDETEWDQIIGRAHRRGLMPTVTFERYDSAVVGSESHKRCAANTLLANLTQRGPDSYGAALRVHNDNELLLDHQTGLHVQGLVCVEAARQMFLAVTEHYILDRAQDVSYYFVINAMNTTFENFLFPVAADVRMTVLAAHQNDADRVSCEADISILQAGRCSARTYVSYTAFRPEALGPIEAKRAGRAVAFAAQSTDVVAEDAEDSELAA